MREKPYEQFEGVYIPSEIFLNEDLSASEMFLLMTINALDKPIDGEYKGCIASNAYFGKFLGKSEGTAANIVVSLKKKGFVEELWSDGKRRGLTTVLKKHREQLQRLIAEGASEYDASRKNEGSGEGSGNREPMLHENVKSRKNEHIVINNKEDVSKEEDTHTLKEKNTKKESSEVAQGMAPGTAAHAFASSMNVALERDVVSVINRQIVAADIPLWKQTCERHYLNLDEAQRQSDRYRRNSLKFILEDFDKARKKRDRENSVASQATAKKINRQAEPSAPKQKQKLDDGLQFRRYVPFSELADEGFTLWEWTEEQYQNFKNDRYNAAVERGNQELIKEIEVYEQIRARRLANRQSEEGARP